MVVHHDSVDDLDRLARKVRDHREHTLGLTQTDFGARGGLSMKTVQRIEAGHASTQPLSLANLDRCAGWPIGSARAILDGGEPLPGDTATDQQDIVELGALLLYSAKDEPGEFLDLHAEMTDGLDEITMRRVDKEYWRLRRDGMHA